MHNLIQIDPTHVFLFSNWCVVHFYNRCVRARETRQDRTGQDSPYKGNILFTKQLHHNTCSYLYLGTCVLPTKLPTQRYTTTTGFLTSLSTPACLLSQSASYAVVDRERILGVLQLLSSTSTEPRRYRCTAAPRTSCPCFGSTVVGHTGLRLPTFPFLIIRIFVLVLWHFCMLQPQNIPLGRYTALPFYSFPYFIYLF